MTTLNADYKIGFTSMTTGATSCVRFTLPIGNLEYDVFAAAKDNIIGRVPAATLAPIHVAVRTDAPLLVIRCLTEGHAAALRVGNEDRALPIHVACDGQVTLEIIRYLVEHAGTLQVQERSDSLFACRIAPPQANTIK